ncbi:hypothetical protein [Nocardia crassostreae]|uniref:hypothetical protein n=1 Tax=Nocardia crassostreae TaxID=53428 RepID=UPI00082DBCDF|nr:hypothetical protein [Nocardia crassostreae]
MPARPLPAEECERLWHAWTPAEAAERLSHTRPCWYVAAGWALDLFVGGLGRDHSDLEIGVPRARFTEIMAAFPGYEWDVIGDGHAWPFPEQSHTHHQTWLREPAIGRYRLDVFREPHVGDRWVYRRDPAITLPHADLILRTSDGIPYLTPEVALLFKAKSRRPKDESDFRHVLPAMDRPQRSRLSVWLSRAHPGHPWLDVLSNHTGSPTA